MNPIIDKLTGLFAGKGADLVNSITGLIDKSKFSAEEKAAFDAKASELAQAHELDMAKVAQTEFESIIKDTANARDSNVHIQESDKASWMSKNVAYIIDLFVIGVWGFLTVYLLCVMLAIVKKETGVDYTAVTAVWGGVTAFAGTVMNFHRGSSVGSKAAGESMRKIAEAK